jgi:hypothetical protein
MEIFINDYKLAEYYLESLNDSGEESPHSIYNSLISLANWIQEKAASKDYSINLHIGKQQLEELLDLIKEVKSENLRKDRIFLLRQSLAKARIKYWNETLYKENSHDYQWLKTSSGYLETIDIASESFAEITERKLRFPEVPYFIFNSLGNEISDIQLFHFIRVQNRADYIEMVTIDANCKIEGVEFWYMKNRDKRYQYEANANIPPSDEQTILVNSAIFEQTSLPLQGGRKVYRHLKNRTYWYVDNLHIGKAAHIEVFDSNGKKHLGEANLQGILDYSKADSTKKAIIE